MLCAALMPCGDKCQGEGKAVFWEVQADICVLGTIRIKADALAVWLPLGGGYTDKRQKDKAQTAKAGGSILPSIRKGIIIRRLYILGEFGMAGDGAKTVIIAGIMRELGLTACALSGAGDICRYTACLGAKRLA